MKNPLVGIVMGSDSDLSVMKKAVDILDRFGILSEVNIASAHRSPDVVKEYALTAASRGVKVIIAGAGGAAHLPGVIAAYTSLPVIGVPVGGSALGGVDALYAIVQMPSGVPVATVAVNGAANAGILAAQIIGSADPEVRARVESYREQMAREVREKNERLQKLGIPKYMKILEGSR